MQRHIITKIDQLRFINIDKNNKFSWIMGIIASMFNKYLLMSFFLILSKQSTFLQHVNFLTRIMSHMGNSFMNTSGDLLVLDTRVIVDSTVVDTIRKVEKLGQAMCDNFSKAVESSTLYIICQVWQISMTEFFSYENQPYPCFFSLREIYFMY